MPSSFGYYQMLIVFSLRPFGSSGASARGLWTTLAISSTPGSCTESAVAHNLHLLPSSTLSSTITIFWIGTDTVHPGFAVGKTCFFLLFAAY